MQKKRNGIPSSLQWRAEIGEIMRGCDVAAASTRSIICVMFISQLSVHIVNCHLHCFWLWVMNFAARLAQIQHIIKSMISLELLLGLHEANPVHIAQRQSEDEGMHSWGCHGECGNRQLWGAAPRQQRYIDVLGRLPLLFIQMVLDAALVTIRQPLQDVLEVDAALLADTHFKDVDIPAIPGGARLPTAPALEPCSSGCCLLYILSLYRQLRNRLPQRVFGTDGLREVNLLCARNPRERAERDHVIGLVEDEVYGKLLRLIPPICDTYQFVPHGHGVCWLCGRAWGSFLDFTVNDCIHF